MRDEFDVWNDKKRRLDERGEVSLFPREDSVWLCVLGRNMGHEQNGGGARFERPVLVIKKFNNRMFWVVPLSTRQKAIDFSYNYTDASGKKVSAILAQMRLISVKRFIRDMHVRDTASFMDVRMRTAGFLGEKSKPRTRRGFSRPKSTV